MNEVVRREEVTSRKQKRNEKSAQKREEKAQRQRREADGGDGYRYKYREVPANSFGLTTDEVGCWE